MALDMKYNSDMKSGDYMFDGSGQEKENFGTTENIITMDGSVDFTLENRINLIDLDRKSKGITSFRSELLKLQKDLLNEGIDKDIIVAAIRELVDKEASEQLSVSKPDKLRVKEVQTINPENLNSMDDLFFALDEYKNRDNYDSETPGIGSR